MKPQYRSSFGGVQPSSTHPIKPGDPPTSRVTSEVPNSHADGRGATSAPRDALDPRALGRRSHEVIARACALGIGEDETALRELARAEWSTDEPLTHRMAVRRRIESDLLAYFRTYGRASEWDFVGAEVQVGRSRLDLLWRRATDGRLEADELKTNTAPTADAMFNQAARQLVAARADLGERFCAVRVCPLRDPRRTLTVDVIDLDVRR